MPISEAALAGSFGQHGSHSFEHRLLLAEGRITFVEERWQLNYDDQGQPIRAVGTCHDITVRKQAEQMLRESEERYRQLIETANEGIWTIDTEGRTTYVNQRIADLLGYTPAEMMGRTHTDFMWEEDRPKGDLDLALRRQGTPLVWDQRYRRKDNSDLWTVASCNGLFDPEGTFIGALGMFTDITERKRAEQVTTRTLERLTEAQRIGQIGDWEWDIATQAITWSPQVFEILGRDPRLGPPRNYEENAAVYDAASQALLKEKVTLANESGEAQNYELRAHRPDGTPVDVLGRAVPRKDESGRIVGLVGTVQDITERKRSESALKKSESRYHSLFENMVEGYAYCRTLFEQDQLRDFTYVEVNGAFEQLTGLKDVVGKKVSEVIPGVYESSPELFEVFNRVALTGKTEKFETYLKPLGIWFSVTVYSREREHFVAVFDNITERKHAEEALAQRARLAGLSASIGVGLIQTGSMGEILQHCSEALVTHLHAAFARIWTLNEAENMLELQASAGMYTHLDGPHARVPVGQFKIGLIASERKPHLTNSVVGDPRVNNQEWAKQEGMVAFAGFPLLLEGRLVGVIGMFARHPLSETTLDALGSVADSIALGIGRKRVEEALRASEAEFRVLAEAMPQIIWVTRPDGWHTHFNQRWLDYTGLTLAESLGHGWLPPFHPDDQPLAAERWQHANQTGEPYEIEYRLRGADGNYRWMLGRAVPLRDEAGGIVKWFGTCTDIHELKEAEREIGRTNRALRASEAHFSGAFEHAPIGMALVAPEGRWLKVNRALCNLVGYSEAELLTRTFQDITHPEDLAADLENVRHLLAGEIPAYEMEKRYIHARGHLISVLLNVSLIRDGEGRPLSFIAQIQDITERKRNEIRFRRLVDSNAQGVFFWNTKGEITGGNDAFLKLVGFTREDLEAGRIDWVAMTPPEYAHLDRIALAELARTGVCPSYEKVWIRKDGSRVPILLGAAMFEDKPDDGVCFVLDITERKLSEAALEQAHREVVEASRLAGMAEVATGILHNVGNVLNSVNIASFCVADSIRKSKAPNLGRVVGLLREHEADLGDFLTVNRQGKQIPGYLAQLAEQLAGEQTAALNELAHLQKNIDHIKDIVAMQQGFAKVSGITELLSVTDLVEDALKMNASALARHDVLVHREFQDVPLLLVEKHQVLQILVNLVRNAMQACDEANPLTKQITLRVTRGKDGVRITVTDNGIGISAENLTRIFAHGFTTKKSGHGFGLHSAALAAKNMGGALTVQSAGPGQGATFTLELPYSSREKIHE